MTTALLDGASLIVLAAQVSEAEKAAKEATEKAKALRAEFDRRTAHSVPKDPGEDYCEAVRRLNDVSDEIRRHNDQAFARIFGLIAEQARKQ
jgi:seryl-tRNA synthetase